MSERQYFSLRYAIPGYAFILLIVGINFFPLLEALRTTQVSEVFGAFLAFLSLFSGSAIGFLIYQVWWLRFQNKVGILGLEEFERSITAFSKKYGLEPPKCNKKAQREFITAIDYATHVEVRENLLAMAERRWDVYHVLSSTRYTLWIGVATGIVGRVYCQFFLFNWTFPCMHEVIVWIGIGVGVFSFNWILDKARQAILTLSATLHEARVRTSAVTPVELKEAFPELYLEHSAG